MIPKIIHLCWLSGDPFPQDIRKCLETWKVHLSDYEIWLWGKAPDDCLGLNVVEKHFDLDSVLWTKQAFEAKKYAFAADYIRLYALYNFGGIYLDADVIVYKPFDELLNLPYFIGADRIGSFEAAVIGCERNCQWIKDIFENYVNRPFIMLDGAHDMKPLPSIFKDELKNRNYQFHRIELGDMYDAVDGLIRVFDADYFNSRDHLRVKRTKKSFCAHNYLGSWSKDKKSIKNRIKMTIPGWIMNIYFMMSHSLWDKHKYDDVKIPFTK